MDLKTFVAETLSQIAEGVVEAQSLCQKRGARVNPPVAGDYRQSDHVWIESAKAPAQFIEFDVAVTATRGSGRKGSVGVVLGTFSIGGSGHSQAETSAASRVKFAVPMVLPKEKRSGP